MEMIDAHAIRAGDGEIPNFNVPSKILCRVVNVKLKAEPHTDEVFAEVTLLPVSEEGENTSENETMQTSGPAPGVISMCKTLTSSDTSVHGTFSILNRHAQECLPQLDMSTNVSEQELVAKDLHGVQWGFRHIYRGQPRRHLLSSGWSTFLNLKKLVAGDAFILVRGENGELRVGIRRAMKRQNIISRSFMSAESMKNGVLVSAYLAINTRTTFTVYYRPRPSGVITGIEDAEPTTWPDSKWKCLKVQWVDIAASTRPERVSPWEVMPYWAAACGTSAISSPKMKVTAHFQFAAESSDSRKDGSLRLSTEPAAEHHAVLQGQERITHFPSMANNNTTWIQEMEFPGPETASPSTNEPFMIFGEGIRTDYLSPMSCDPGGSGSVNAQLSLTHPVTVHSRTKVHKHGYAVGRKVALSRFSGYEELLGELDKMFDFGGGLVDGSKRWKVIYTDAKEDTKILGNCQWL